MINYAGGKKGEILVAVGIKKVSELKEIRDEDLSALKDGYNGISIATLKKWKDLPVHDGK